MVRPIRTERDYEDALGEIGRLMTALPGTAEGDQVDVFSTLVGARGASTIPSIPPTRSRSSDSRWSKRGAGRAELVPIIGSRGRVSEVLGRKRPLTLAIIRKLNDQWGLPADVLVRPYSLHAARRKRAEPRR